MISNHYVSLYVTVAAIGLVVGSFLNVCIARLPLGASIVQPGSTCPFCSKAIAWKDNVPLVSFVLLGGRCRSCHHSISFEYPLVELMNAVGYLAILEKFGWGAPMVVYAIFFSALLTITWIDFHHKIIPDVISLPGIVLGLLFAGTVLPLGVVDSLIGIVVGGGLLWGIAAVSPLVFGKEGLGGGDIKLLAMMGAFLGWQGALLTLMIASIVGSIIGIVLILCRYMSRSQYLPFGPFLAFGALLSLFFQQEIFEWYLGVSVR